MGLNADSTLLQADSRHGTERFQSNDGIRPNRQSESKIQIDHSERRRPRPKRIAFLQRLSNNVAPCNPIANLNDVPACDDPGPTLSKVLRTILAQDR